MDNYEKINNNYICPYCDSQIILPNYKLSNDIYDSNFVSLINSLSSHIKIFYDNINKILNDIKSVNSTLGSQTNHSKYLVKGISIKNNNYIERYRQLCDRIDMITESQKLLDDNFSLINNNINIFISEAKQIFRKIKILRVKKITETINNNNNYLGQINNIINNNKEFSDNNESHINNYNRNDNINISKNYLFKSIDNENDITRKVLSSNLSPKNKLSLSRDNNDYNKSIENIEFLVNKIKANELKKKNNNNMLIFPNNINQNIFNCTITSREFNNLHNNRNIDYFSGINNRTIKNNKPQKIIKYQKFSRNNSKFENKNIKVKKINRSSSIPEMQNKNRRNISISSPQNYSQNKGIHNSLPKQYSENYIVNKHYNINNSKINNSNDKVNILLLCNKVKEFLNDLNNNYQNNNFIEKKYELNSLVNNLLKKEKEKIEVNINNNLEKGKNNNILKSNNKIQNNNDDNLKLIKYLKDKINQLEKSINEKNKLLEDINKKKDINPINNNEKIITEKNNKILELNNNIKKLKKENNELKNNIINLKNINNQGAEKLKEVILSKDNEIEELKSKISSLESEKELLNKKNENELNNQIDYLKQENNKNEQTINELTKSLKEYEENKNKEKEENKLLKEENISLKNKIEDFKNSLIDKKRKIQELTDELENLKKKKNSIDEAKKNSRLVMEIASLKKINGSLNKKLNEFKKKNSRTNLNTVYNNNYNQNDTSSSQDFSNINKLNEKIQNFSNQNKDLSQQISKLSSEKKELEISNNEKSEQIKKMENIIDELNKKKNDIKVNNNSDNIKITNSFTKNEQQSLILTENSNTNEIVNYNSKEMKNKDIEEYKKENEELNKKIKTLTNQYEIELSIYKNEYEALKKENIKLNSNKDLEGLKNSQNFTPDKYNILCDKNYEKLQWFLLIPKNTEFDNNYNNLIWVAKDYLDNIDKFNKFESEIEIQNKTIINYIKKLEEKEEIISNLSLKYKKSEPTNNHYTSNNYDNGISLEKFNIVVNQLNDAEDKLKILQEENRKLKQNSPKTPIMNKIRESTEESNYLGYNKNYVLNIKEEKTEDVKNNNINEMNNIESVEEENEDESENYSETDTELSELKSELENIKIENNKLINEYKNLENKMKILKESFSNLLIKMTVPKKHKEEIKEILKLFEFTENEILFIVDKKKQY